MSEAMCLWNLSYLDESCLKSFNRINFGTL